MLTIKEGMTLYHGSYAEVSAVELARCAPGKDFGQGFYTTTSIEQARSFVALSARKRMAIDPSSTISMGFVSTYVLHGIEGLSCHVFGEADKDWLHFVAANRRGELFSDLVRDLPPYDIVAGKIANDRTARTLQLYLTGAFGDPGTAAADNAAIAMLLPNRLEDQVCLRTPAAIDRLEFVGSRPYAL